MHPINNEKIEGKARVVIDAYLALPFGAKPNCPYFNNRRRKIRGSLRVVKGKGTPEEIAEECEIDAKLARIKIVDLSADKLKEFLIENDLGIDCSGFAYHVLNAFCQERTNKNLQSFVKPLRHGFFGGIIGRLRPAENIGVTAFLQSSKTIKIGGILPGDVIIFQGTGKEKIYNHILVITAVHKTDDDTLISYAHSYDWPSDGKLEHGVREGQIIVHGEDLLGGTWKEKNQTGIENYTFESAKNAQEVRVRRLAFNE